MESNALATTLTALGILSHVILTLNQVLLSQYTGGKGLERLGNLLKVTQLANLQLLDLNPHL